MLLFRGLVECPDNGECNVVSILTRPITLLCRGDFGRLGHGECNDVFIPRAIDALRGRAVVRVACGDTHTLAVTEAGDLYSFGRNANGQLGHGTTDDSLAPRLIEALKVRQERRCKLLSFW